MVTIPKDEEEITKRWNHPISISPDHDFYKLLLVVGRENKRIGLDIEEIYDDRFLGSAAGRELEKIGDLVGVKRKNAEGDAKLRKRIRAEFAAQASDTTYDNFATAALSILEARPAQISIATPPETIDKNVELKVDGGVIDENPLTRTELADLLDRTVSAGAKVNLIETGTFAFAGDDSALKGWNEGTWSSTVE